MGHDPLACWTVKGELPVWRKTVVVGQGVGGGAAFDLALLRDQKGDKLLAWTSCWRSECSPNSLGYWLAHPSRILQAILFRPDRAVSVSFLAEPLAETVDPQGNDHRLIGCFRRFARDFKGGGKKLGD